MARDKRRESQIKEKRHKILLVEPPFYRLFKDTYSLNRLPLSLGYLAGAIQEETNWGVMVFNADFDPSSSEWGKPTHSYLASKGFDNYLNNLRELPRRAWKHVTSTITEYGPAVVAISAKSQNFASARIVAKIAKDIDQHTLIIMGGPHASMAGRDLLKYPEIDLCVKGEGENTIVELLNALETQKQFDDIRGIIYRQNGRIVENASREPMKDLDSLRFPHETAPAVLKDYNQYPVTAFKYVVATRGCPYDCLFCGSREVWGRTVRFRSPQNVVREIKNLQRMGLRRIHFCDDTFGVNRRYINELCNSLILHCPGLQWSCETHVSLVDEQTTSLMKSAGCYSIQIGIESANNGILSAMRKGTTIEEALAACEIIKKQCIELQAFFMVGFPQETEETLEETVAAIKKSKSDILIYSIFTPYPYTEAFEFCKERGLTDDDYDVSLYNHQSPANCFCLNITPERFRMLAGKIERMVDRKNMLNRMKKVLSLSTLARVQELGVGRSLKAGMRMFLFLGE